MVLDVWLVMILTIIVRVKKPRVTPHNVLCQSPNASPQNAKERGLLPLRTPLRWRMAQLKYIKKLSKAN